MARASFPALRAVVKELIYGPEPVGLDTAAVLELELRAELSGQMGTVHWGEAGSAETTCAAWIASPQVFQGNAQMGATLHPQIPAEAALPNAQPPSQMATWLYEWDSMEGLVP